MADQVKNVLSINMVAEHGGKREPIVCDFTQVDVIDSVKTTSFWLLPLDLQNPQFEYEELLELRDLAYRSLCSRSVGGDDDSLVSVVYNKLVAAIEARRGE